MKRRSRSFLVVTLLAGTSSLLSGCSGAPTTKDEIRTQLTALEFAVPKGEGFEPEANYLKVRSRGSDAVPALIDLISDDKASSVHHIHRYRIGDLALAILLEMTGREFAALPRPVSPPGSEGSGVIAIWAGLEERSARAAVQADMAKWWTTHKASLRWDKLSRRFVRTP